ncbi:QcrA and Rieske domain-containing protein [Robertmurraya sp. GLU-23]
MLNRRDFISKSLKGTTGLIVISIVPLGLSACSNKELSLDTDSMVNLGPLTELNKGLFPKKVPYKVNIKDAWTEQKMEGFVYIIKNSEDNNLLILSPICTHLGCVVGDADENLQKEGIRYYCPCHGGQYDEYGVNVGGPPPRPLDMFSPYVENGNVYISILNPTVR